MPSRGTASTRRTASHIVAAFLYGMLPVAAVHAAIISNTGRVTYQIAPAGAPIEQLSNTVSLTSLPAPTPAQVGLAQYAPGAASSQATSADGTQCADAGGAFGAVPPMTSLGGQPIDLAAPAPLVSTGAYHAAEPVFVTLADGNRNLDPLVRDTIELTITTSGGDEESLRLAETGANTGVFAGAIPSVRVPPIPVRFDCRLSLAENGTLTAAYSDSLYPADTSSATALVDPFGHVFDSRTGLPIDGVSVTLIDLATGQPATVFGDDGTSPFPSTVASGGTATDGAGIVYGFPPGGFRFPFVAAGTYRYEVAAPPGYTAPSTVPPNVLRLVLDPAGLPYVITAGSLEDAFALTPGPAVRIDIPLDPLSTALVIEKQASRQTVTAGDFLQYRLTVSNSDPGRAASNVRVTDVLPLGFRYRPGSARVEGQAVADPAISGDGRTLSFTVATLAAGATATLSYVLEVGAGTRTGTAVNSASAIADGAVSSNLVQAQVRVQEPFFGNCAVLIGRVVEGECGTAPEKLEGVPNVRVMLDDGTYTSTDTNGQFHFEKVCGGTHVVQLDVASLPHELQPVACSQNTRFAGSAFSQFVDVRGGALWRTDFHVREKPPIQGAVGLSLKSTVTPRLGTIPGISTVRDYSLNVRFQTLEATLRPDGERAVDDLLRQLAGADISRIEVVGHTDDVRIAAGGRRRFRDNYELSAARARTVADRLAAALALAPERVDSSGRGPDEPVATNATAEGRASNRRVDVSVRSYQSRAPIATRTGDELRFRAELDGGMAPVANLRATVLLPDGVQYTRGSTRIDGVSSGDPAIDGQALTFRLGEPGQDWRRILEFSASAASRIDSSGQSRTYRTKAVAMFDTDVHLSGVTPAAETVNDGEAAAGNPASAVSAESTRQEGIALSRAAAVAQPAAAGSMRRSAIVDDATAAGGSTNWLQEAERAPATRFLFPQPGHNPRAPAVRVVISHDPAQRVRLRIGETPVDPLSLDGTETSADGRVAVSIWRGVPLVDGDNSLSAELVNADGSMLQSLSQTVHFANTPVRAALVPEQSLLVADGITNPVVAVRFLDRGGRPVRAGVTGAFVLGAPYVPQQLIDRQQQRQLAGPEDFAPMWTIEGDDGIAWIELAPTTASGQVVLDFAFQNERNVRRQQLRAWLDASAREWILVGLAEGTLGHRTLSGNMQALADAGEEADTVTDGQASFYAKGRVRGAWLATLAYDSDKPPEDARRQRLQQVIDPDEFYLLYGDGTEQRYDASSQEKLYVRLERPQFYALFGDYDTGLTHSELTRYSRSLNGVKSEYAGERFQYAAFAADTPQSFVRDEIQGAGISGLYRLSRPGIVINSEKVLIETRDRLRSERVLESRYLLRHIDYDIDYTNGTLFFREPVPSRDVQLNPVFIIADYEVFAGGDTEMNAGGRMAATLLDGRLTGGIAYIRDETQSGKTDLAGLDMKMQLGNDTELRLEGAGSESAAGASSQDGSAYLAEFEHVGARWDALVYVRRHAPAFGVGQQFSAETGQFKVGAAGRVSLGERTALTGELYEQENLVSNAVRDAALLRAEYRTPKGGISGGLQHAEDETAQGEVFESQQLLLGAERKFWNGSIELTGQAEVSLGDRNDSLDFPSRYLAQAAYALTPDAKLVVAQELTDGEAFDTQTTRLGVVGNPWQGARLNSTLNQSIDESGPRTFAAFGLTQSVLIGRRWGFDVGLDHSRTFHESGATPPRINPDYPIAAGSGAVIAAPGGVGISTEDFTAVSGGATYRAELWSWNARSEVRDGMTDDRRSLTTSFLREARAGVAFALSAQIFDAEREGGAEGLFGSIDLSWAYRPLARRWSLLDRLELRFDELENGTGTAGSGLFGFDSLTAAGTARSRALINNLSVNGRARAWSREDRSGDLFAAGERHQWSLYYGSKYSFDRFDGVEYRGYTDMLALEWRFDVRPWLDLGLQASVLHSWEADTHRFSLGPSVGFSPIAGSWITLGYNAIGFRDRDFEAAKYTARGPYLQVRFKLDQTASPFGGERAR